MTQSLAMRTNEAQSQQADSIETYLFTTAATEYAYTSCHEDVTIGARTYTAAPIRRSAFTRDVNLQTVTCQIAAPITTFFQQYIANTPIIPVQVEIRKYFVTDYTQSILVFYGVIIDVTIKGRAAEASCVSSGYELKEKVPHVFYQSYCNNTLYGDVCGLDEDAWKVDAVIEDIDNTNDEAMLKSSTFDLGGSNPLALGRVKFGSDERFITGHNRERIWIHFPFNSLSINDTVTAHYGCDKHHYSCLFRFNNLNNFVGFPYIPQGKNPTRRPIK